MYVWAPGLHKAQDSSVKKPQPDLSLLLKAGQQTQSVVATPQRSCRNPTTIKENSKPPFSPPRGYSCRRNTDTTCHVQTMEIKRVFAPLGLCLVGWGSLNGIFNNYHSRPLSQVPVQVSWSPFGHWESFKVTLDPSLLHTEQSQLSTWYQLSLVVSDIGKCP